jgi:hypothetical protein
MKALVVDAIGYGFDVEDVDTRNRTCKPFLNPKERLS